MIVAVVLAAGRSSRMGRAKALLPHRDAGTTFVRHLIMQAHAAGIDDVLVVGRPEDEPLRREVISAGGRFVENPGADQGQLSSLVAAIHDLSSDPGCEGLLTMPVDVPLVSSDVIREVITRAAASDALIARAAHGSVHGHPVLFKRSVFVELLRADPHVGARAVVRADPRRVLDVEVDDDGVVADVDTPDDYERLFGRRLE